MTKQEFLVELEDILQREEPCLENDSLEDYIFGNDELSLTKKCVVWRAK